MGIADRRRTGLVLASAVCLVLSSVSVAAESKPHPAVTLDLKTFGMAADMFSNASGNRDQARGLLNTFWISPDRLVAAFNTSSLFTKPNHPGPFQVRLVVFDATGRQQASRDWSFAATGPESDAMLAIVPGPDQTILAVHYSTNDVGGTTEGNQVQVLSQNTKLLQNFYVPSDSVIVPSIPAGSSLVLEQTLPNSSAMLHFFSGNPLKSHINVALAHQTETLAGPDEAAHLVCPKTNVCPEVQVTQATGKPWSDVEKPPLVPHPRAFLNPSTLLIEVEVPGKANRLLLLHSDGSHTDLPPMKSTDSVTEVSGVSADGLRFAIDTDGESGLCGIFDFTCSHHGNVTVYDVGKASGAPILLQLPLSEQGGKSALSPDGKHLAVLDRGKLLIYVLQ